MYQPAISKKGLSKLGGNLSDVEFMPLNKKHCGGHVRLLVIRDLKLKFTVKMVLYKIPLNHESIRT